MPFDTFQIWEAKGVAPNNTFAMSDHTIENNDELHLDYCIPMFSKRQTNVTGVESPEENHPDTGPAGAFVELQFTAIRADVDYTDDFLAQLIRWYQLINTEHPFLRGFLGLTNTDNPRLNTVPTSTQGYRLIDFRQVTPQTYHGKQTFVVRLQRGGKWT